MVKKIDMTNKKIGRLLVLEEIKKEGKKGVWYKCLCDCGKYTETKGEYLRNGDTKSCGCLHGVNTGLRNHPLYMRWYSMVQRCSNENHSAYKHYGGRGIKVCEEWMDFKKYINDIENKFGEIPEGYELDRINNDDGYYIDNIRCVSKSVNRINTRDRKSKTNNRNIVKRCDLFFVQIRRDKKVRNSKSIKDINQAIKLRDQWLKEYEEDKEKWIEDTINNNYIKK